MILGAVSGYINKYIPIHIVSEDGGKIWDGTIFRSWVKNGIFPGIDGARYILVIFF